MLENIVNIQRVGVKSFEKYEQSIYALLQKTFVALFTARFRTPVGEILWHMVCLRTGNSGNVDKPYLSDMSWSSVLSMSITHLISGTP